MRPLVPLGLLLLACCGATGGDDEGLDPELTALAGRWRGDADVVVDWCERDAVALDLVVDGWGGVTGTIGDATLVDGVLEHNRGAVDEALGLFGPLIVRGEFEGPLVREEDLRREAVTIPFAVVDGVWRGAVHSSGWHVGPPDRMVFTATFDALRRVADDVTERTARLEPRLSGTIPNLTTHGGVWMAGQPRPDDLRALAEGGLAAVVDLRHPDEHDFDEAGLVASLGMIYENPAWNGVDELTDETFADVLERLEAAPRPLLLHCGSANRVGAIWYAYRALHDGLGHEQALAEARAVGLRTPGYRERAVAHVEARRR